MTDAARIGWVAADTRMGSAQSNGAKRAPTARHADNFHQALVRSLRTGHARPATSDGSGTIGATRTAMSAPVRTPRPMPEAAEAALATAMRREGVPDTWREGLRFIMEKEAGGRIDVRNPVHSARGLFQLTRANYHLNPNGAASFGNGVEEAQGGIRYIKQRYGSVTRAVDHWQKHRWY